MEHDETQVADLVNPKDNRIDKTFERISNKDIDTQNKSSNFHKNL